MYFMHVNFGRTILGFMIVLQRRGTCSCGTRQWQSVVHRRSPLASSTSFGPTARVLDLWFPFPMDAVGKTKILLSLASTTSFILLGSMISLTTNFSRGATPSLSTILTSPKSKRGRQALQCMFQVIGARWLRKLTAETPSRLLLCNKRSSLTKRISLVASTQIGVFLPVESIFVISTVSTLAGGKKLIQSLERSRWCTIPRKCGCIAPTP